MSTTQIFPVGLFLADHPVAVVGAGHEAEDKLSRLLDAGANVTVYAPVIEEPGIASWIADGTVEHVDTWLDPADVGRYHMVLSTRMDRAYSAALAEACRSARTLVSCYDQIQYSDISMPALVRRGLLRIAIFTAGASPSLAGRIRRSLEALFDEQFEHFLAELGHLRERLKQDGMDFTTRRRILNEAVKDFEIVGEVRYPQK